MYKFFWLCGELWICATSVNGYVLNKTKCEIDFVFVCFPIGVADTDQSTGPKMTSVSHPEKVKKALTADHHHKVIIKFSVKDKASGEKVNFGIFIFLQYLKEDHFVTV